LAVIWTEAVIRLFKALLWHILRRLKKTTMNLSG